MRATSAGLAGLLMAVVLPLAAAGTSTVYRWTDAEGQVHFSQVPPPEGTPHQIIQGPGRAAAPAAAPGDDTASSSATAREEAQREQTRRFLERRDAENRARDEARSREREQKETAARQCQEAKERAQFLEERTARRLVIPAEDGNLARMEEDEFMRRLNQAKQDVASHCR